MLDAVKAWLGTERVNALNEQVEGRLDAKIEGVVRHAPDAPTAAVWTLQACGSKATPEDLRRWSADVRALKAAKRKSGKAPVQPPAA